MALPAMKFYFKKVVVNGKRMYQYQKAENVLGINDLPYEYICGGVYVRQNYADHLSIVYGMKWEATYLFPMQNITIKEFEKFKKITEDAGSRLGKMRHEQILKEWTGEEVIVQ